MKGMKSTKRIALILGGGGAKGISHIGILQGLEKEGLRPSFIMGTSMGSIIGSLYAKGYSSDELASLFRKKTITNILSLNDISLKKGLFKGKKIRKMLEELLSGSRFSGLSIRFNCNATDLFTGEEVVFRTGIVSDAVVASCAIPLLFSPITKGRRKLIDGSYSSNISFSEIKKHITEFDLVIAVNCISNPPKDYDMNSISIGTVAVHHLIRAQLHRDLVQLRTSRAKEDIELNKRLIVLEPDTHRIPMFNFKNIDYAIKKGLEEWNSNKRKIIRKLNSSL